LTPAEKEALGERLKEYRREMKEFSQFLQEKFFREGEK